MTKKERKIKEQESDDRLISAIISDTKAGKSVIKDVQNDGRKRENKAKAKAGTAEEKAMKQQEVGDEDDDKTGGTED